MLNAMRKLGENCCRIREERDLIKLRETNKRLSGIGHVELDLQEQKEVISQQKVGVCVCVSHMEQTYTK